jgi:hypothetical protein
VYQQVGGEQFFVDLVERFYAGARLVGLLVLRLWPLGLLRL